MIPARLLASLLLFLACTAHAHAQRVTAVDPARSEVRFAGKQMGVPAEGRFNRIKAQVEFDAAKPAAGRASVEIDLNSVDIGAADVNTEVKRRPWFNVNAFPAATFVSSSMRQTAPGRYEAQGKLTIKGQARDVVAPFTVRQEGKDVVIEGAFTLLRLQFGVGDGPWADTDTVANEVQVRFKLVGPAAK